MHNRFGAKDAVLFALIAAVGIGVWLAMVQEDRRWSEVRAIRQTLENHTRQLSEIQRGLDATGAPAGSTVPVQPRLIDDSWARPGVAIERPPAWGFAHDPRSEPDFAEGGTLTEMLEGVPPRLTPYTHNDLFYSRIVNETVCESLAMYDAQTLEYRAWLAEAWQMDPEGLWLRVKIRDEARFSDGKPVTADDVRYTVMEHVFNPEIEAQAARAEMSAISDVQIIAPKVVEFRFREKLFLNKQAALRNSILPAHFYRQFTPKRINESTGLVMGSGPWKFASLDPAAQWTPPNPVELVRNEHYWGVRPPIERLRFTLIRDPVARLTEFENGSADIVRGMVDQYEKCASDPAFVEKHTILAWTNMRSGYTFIGWNCGLRAGKPTPFSDRRVRQAMTLLLDRARINRDFFAGVARVATGPFPPGQADPRIQPWPVDETRARALLRDAGWEDRDGDGRMENASGDLFRFEILIVAGNTFSEKLAQYLRDRCAAVGIECVQRATDWASLESIRDARDFDAISMSWSWSNPESDPYQVFHSSQISGQGDNWIQWSNPAADALIEQARRTIDAGVRRELWHQLHALLHEEQPYTFLLETPWIRFVSKRIRNVHTYPVGLHRWEMYIPSAMQ